MKSILEMTLAELLNAKDEISERIAFLTAKEKTAHVIKYTESENACFVEGYYNSCFVTKARGLKGSFQGGKWAFALSVSDHVKNAMRECYGVDGVSPYVVKKLVVKNWDSSTYTDGLELFGRPVAKAWGRDSGAKISDDIFLIDGKLTSGGSVKNWSTKAVDATFEIHNFPIEALEREDVKKAIEEGWVIVE